MQCFEIRERNSSNFYIKLVKLKLLQGKTKLCFTREFFFGSLENLQMLQ